MSNKTKEAFIFLGAPASGKSSLSNFFSKQLNAQLVRGKDIRSDQISCYEPIRELVPDFLFVPALLRTLTDVVAGNPRTIVLDNIPRTTNQAEVVSDIMQQNSTRVYAMILHLDPEEVLERFNRRLICQACDSTYHPQIKPSVVEGVCDVDGSRLANKQGDKPSNLLRGYIHYKNILEIVVPVLEKRCQIIKISARGTVAETAQRINASLDLRVA